MMDREYVGIRQATQKGYIECEIGGVADFSYPTSKLPPGELPHRDNCAGGGRTVCSIVTISRKGVQKWQK